MIVYPGAFSKKTGPLHWQKLLEGRAIDNECYIVGCSTAVNNESKYEGYGHSMVVSPWGKVLLDCGEKEMDGMAYIDMDEVKEMRKQIPLLEQKILL